MELVVLFVFGVLLTLVIGAIMGFAAMARAGRLERELVSFKDEVGFEISFLREKLARVEANRCSQEIQSEPVVTILHENDKTVTYRETAFAVNQDHSEAESQHNEPPETDYLSGQEESRSFEIEVIERDSAEAVTTPPAIPMAIVPSEPLAVEGFEPLAVEAIEPLAVEATEHRAFDAAEPQLAEASESLLSESSQLRSSEEEDTLTSEASHRAEPSMQSLPALAEPVANATRQPIENLPSRNVTNVSTNTSTDSQPETTTDRDWWRLLEERIGKRWITWAGVLALFIGAGFFVSHAMDQGWLGPWWRVGLSMMLGVSLVGAGVRFMLREMRSLGQGLVGGGLGVLYAAIYAANGYYELVPNIPAFAVMIVVTAAGMWLAVRCDARPIAFLAVLGGALTPIMLWPDIDPGHALFAYMLCLDLGVLFVALSKKWRALDVLAMVGTSIVFMTWHGTFFVEGEHVAPMAWLGAFALVFLIIPFIYHLRHRTTIARERLAMALSSGCSVFAYAIMVIPDQPILLGTVAIILSSAYLVVAWLTHRRIPTDRHARFSLITLSIAFFSVAIPIVLDLHAVTMAWAMEGVVLVYIGARYRYLPDRVFGLLALTAAVSRVLFFEWPRLGSTMVAPFWNADLGSALFVVLAGGAVGIVCHRHRAALRPAERWVKLIVVFSSVLIGLSALNSELWWALTNGGSELVVRWVSALLWIAGGVALLVGGLGLRSIHGRFVGFGALLCAFVFIVWDYGLGWQGSSVMVGNGRFLAGIVALFSLLAFSIASIVSARCTPWERRAGVPLLGAAMTGLAILGSFEFFQGFTATGLIDQARSVPILLWVVMAAVGLVVSSRVRFRRISALSLAFLALATFLSLMCYGVDMTSIGAVIGTNLRFGAAMSVGVLLVVSGLWIRRTAPGQESALATTTFGAGLISLAFFSTIELWSWLPAMSAAYLSAFCWSAVALVLFGSGVGLRSVNMRILSWGALLVSSGFVIWDTLTFSHHPWFADQLLLLNGQFLAGLTTIGVLFTLTAITWRIRDRFTETEVRAVESLVAIGLVLTPTLLSVELATHLGFGGFPRFAVVIIWLSFTLLSMIASKRARLVNIRWLGLLHIGIAALIVGFWYRADLLNHAAMVLFNVRFLAAVMVGVVLLAYGLWLHRVELGKGDREGDISALGHSLVALGGIGLAFGFCAEVWDWLDCCPERYGLLTVLLTLAWAIGSASLLGAGIKLESSGLRRASLVVLTVAGVIALICYTFPLRPEALIVINGRFSVVALVVALVFVCGVEARLRSSRIDEGRAALHRESSILFGIGTTLAVALFSVETVRFFHETVSDPERARWLAQMGLTVVWSLSAGVVVAAGFWRKRRALRLAGLGLFAVTAAKLLLVDTAQVEGGYRVASFMILGIVMISASYLYHRVEKWMSAHQA